MEEEVVMEEGTKKTFPIKKTIITVIVVAIVLALLIGIINSVKPSPEKTVKNFLKLINKGKIAKAYEYVDIVGMEVFSVNDLEDFVDDYKDFKDDHEDEIEDAEETMKEYAEEYEEELEDYDEFSVEIKKISKAKKVKKAKNLYKVTAKVKTVVKEDEDDDTDRDTNKIDFYVYKVNGKYKIVGMKGGSFLNF